MLQKKKCIVMLSGGLDSLLAVKIMQEQNFDVLALYFKLPFIKDIEKEIKEFCKKEKLKLKIFDCTDKKLFREYLKIIKNPKYGTGVGMNPCIDCRIFILKKAKKFADNKKFNIIVTGEVLGERPLSQTKKALELIEKKSGLENRLLRPLSAKFFSETQAEKEKLVNREKFYDICGRKRQRQIALAKKFGISYPSPAGGCLLCEKLYCKKLNKILNKKNLNHKDIELLKIGRHFEASNIILGRNEKENKLLEKEKAIIIIPKQAGPTALIKNKKYEKKAKELIQKYSKYKIKEFEVRDKNV